MKPDAASLTRLRAVVDATGKLDDPAAMAPYLAESRGRLHGEALGSRYWLTVSDDGPGIPPEVLPRLFQPFFTTREGGMGLGLSLSETLAHGMHGQLTAANLPTGGACFTLSLPLAENTA